MASKKKNTPPQKPKADPQPKAMAPQPSAKKKAASPKVLTLILVVFIAISALVGLGYIELPQKATDIKILGKEAYENQPRTPLVARSERPDSMTETSILLLDAPDEATQAPVNVETETATNLVAEVTELQNIIDAQQQMLRMMNQKQEQHMAAHQAQMLKLGEALNQLRTEFKQTDTAVIEKHLARLYLLQGADRLYQQWQDGILLPDTVEAWAAQAGAGGFKEAQSLGIALASMMEADGLLNEQELYRRVVGLRSAYLAAQKAAEQAQAEEQGFWAYLKSKLRALIQIDRVEQTADLSDELIAPLKSGDIPTFWQVLSQVEKQDTTDLTRKVRQLVEAHTSQKYSFDTLYQALANQPRAKVAAVVVVTPEGKEAPEASKPTSESTSDTQPLEAAE